MEFTPPHLYRAEGARRNVPESVLRKASLAHSRSCVNGLTPILSLRHLSHLTGAPYWYLRNIVSRVEDPYVDIKRTKRNGGHRNISSPEPMLMDVQRWILHNVLEKLSVHSASFAYQRNSSILSCAQRHIGASWLVKFDIHDFFNSIEEASVFEVFHRSGYSRLVSLELARICTRLYTFRTNREFGARKYKIIESYAVGSQGFLPQGAPTSGFLANIVAHAMDSSLYSVAKSQNLVYTRYSDDLTFSAGPDFDRQKASELISVVRKQLGRHGFSMHEKKTGVISPGARKIVLGLLVDSTEVRLLPEFKRRVFVHIRGVDKFGLVHHVEHRGFDSIFSFINHINGMIAFSYGIDPECGAEMQSKWVVALRKSGYPAADPEIF